MKQKKLPKMLYHYTSTMHIPYILEDGYLKLTPSNLKMDSATLHAEPVIRNGEETHILTYRDKYANYHPVVWLTSNSNAVFDETGLTEDKVSIRLTIPTAGKEYKYMNWSAFLDKYHGEKQYSDSLKRANGADWKKWYICETLIPLTEVSEIIDMQTLQPIGR